jgi:hypothetical protein
MEASDIFLTATLIAIAYVAYLILTDNDDGDCDPDKWDGFPY